MGKENDDRREILVSLSVVALISDLSSTSLLLVKDVSTGKWGPPAGRLNWLAEDKRLETFSEGLIRELHEETGIRLSEEYPPKIEAIINMPGEDKYRMGVVYELTAGDEVLGELGQLDADEIEGIRFFTEDDLLALLDQEDAIDRLEF